MSLAKREIRAPASLPTGIRARHETFPTVSELLAGGGDPRLSLSPVSGQNMYGCAPFPLAGRIDFASSTASSISQEAFAHVALARAQFMARSLVMGPEEALQFAITQMRRDLLNILGMDAGTELVLTASGTDAQLQALFLAKTNLGTPLTTIVVGADQNGNGAGFAATGRHFSHATAHGASVAKGGAIDSLANGVRKIEIPFWDSDSGIRSLREMDALVLDAVAEAATRGEKILLQTMEASKFAWRAPSDECLAEIAARWPRQVQVVIDACQMRMTRERLAQLVGKGYMALITGSKFFTGPPFSGGVLIPPELAATFSKLTDMPAGLSAYTSRFDWPADWAICAALSDRPNYGQWIRWEAAIEEMRLYFAVPTAFRRDAQAALADRLAALIAASPNLCLLPNDIDLNPAGKNISLFAFVPHRNGVSLSAEETAIVYRALRRDLSNIAAIQDDEKECAGLLCQIGQPVALPNGETALRMSLSSRIIRNCWSADEDLSARQIAAVADKAALVVQKLNFATANIEKLS